MSILRRAVCGIHSIGFNPITTTFYEGESGTQPAATGTATQTVEPPVTPPTVTPTIQPVALTPDQQKWVNGQLAEERRKATQQAQAANQKTIEQLEVLKTNQNLTQQERDRLQIQIEELKTQFQTKEQQAQTELTKLQEKLTTTSKDLTKDRDLWRGRYEHKTKSVEINEAAKEHKAISGEQIEAILYPITKVVEILDDGKPTGELGARVNFTGKDKDNKPVKLELSVSDAVKAMKEWPEKYGNLFHSESKGGVGATPNNGSVAGTNGAIPDIENMTPQQYAANRVKIRAEMAKAGQ